jgi:RNA polymerase sigma factor (sigma-70 family)
VVDQERAYWIGRARKGDPAALEYLFRCLDAPVRKLVERLAPVGLDAEDVVSETVITVFETISSLRDEEKLEAYAVRIARRIIQRERRKASLSLSLSLSLSPTGSRWRKGTEKWLPPR